MAKTKSPTGSKTRKTVNQEQTPNTAPAAIPQVSAVPSGITTAEAASQVKITPQTKPAPAPAPAAVAETKTAPEAKSAVVKAPEAKATEPTSQPKPAPEAKTTAELRKFEVVKTEPRKNVVPINRTPVNLEEEVRRRAYEIYQQRAGAPGNQQEDWLNAEREVRKRYQQQSA